MFPLTLALVDDDAVYTEILAHALKARGCRVDVFGDSNELLARADAFDYDFYVLDLMLPGVDGVELIKVLRRRSTAGVLVVSGRLAPEVFADVVGAGADMYLGKPLDATQVVLAVQAVHRRARMANRADTPWRLERRARQLTAPDGARVDLSDSDLALLECFVEADGEAVTREALCLSLGRVPEGDAADGLNSTIHRLKRRIERATQRAAPLQSKSRVGYVFRAPLKAA
jgi:DNA-binding response OmpR family regulator